MSRRYLPPINLRAWIDEHRHLLKPPVGNKCVYEDAEFIIMVVGGPNARKDFHIEAGEEFFYQLEGEIVVRTFEDGDFHDISIKAGEIFLLPPGIPHSPQRMAESVGLVVERKRRPGELDGLRWYCDNCKNVLYEEFFALTDIAAQLKPVIEKFTESRALRTCDQCGDFLELPNDPDGTRAQ